ncbi:MAG: hypothetical protein ACRD3A_07720 [Terriglobales bacterium]
MLSSGAVEEVSQRIRRVTEDLRAIQEELNRAAALDPERPERSRLLDELVTLDLLADFRSAIDHLRTFLWAYVEAATRKSGGSVDSTLQEVRIQRATEMLRMLREQLSAPNSTPVPEVRSLFEEISALAHTAYDRHVPAVPPESSGQKEK